ncbi:hypothetical protein [Pedobacter arcticus]|uniref:hypothetical protein n=1 Tax=Pedobacter arcticus TaxID=752140 RepID=UPI00031ECC63|nr:hypothetical protein [Pedobacter arcticus]
MEELLNIVKAENEELLSTLDPYQKDIIQTFLDNNANNYSDGVDRWLNATLSNTSNFGGEGRSKVYREKLLEEFEKFLCGDDKYEEDRKKIEQSSDKSHKYIVGVLSAAIGNSLGISGIFLAPVIVLLILNIGKMALNAWCEMRKDSRDNKTNNNL